MGAEVHHPSLQINYPMKSVFSLTLLLFTLLALPYAVLAQSDSEDKGSLKSGTIDSQFDYIYSVSNNYQEYKVVKRTNLDQLKSNMLDSMQTMRKEVADLNIDRIYHGCTSYIANSQRVIMTLKIF